MTRDLTAEYKQTINEVCPDFFIDNYNQELMNSIYRYAIKHPQCKLDTNKGLFLYGQPGTGKSTVIKILAEFIRKFEPKESFKLINTAYLAAQYSTQGAEALEESTWNRGPNGNNPVTRAFDELGREPIPAINYGTSLNTMRYVLELRYTSHSITHITTNLNPALIADIYGDHIADRAIEMFNFIEVKGPTRRK